MTEQELRQLVRDAIARAGVGASTAPSIQARVPARPHPSFTLLTLPAGADSDGPCIIEPAVSCNHCGYCKTYGH